MEAKVVMISRKTYYDSEGDAKEMRRDLSSQDSNPIEGNDPKGVDPLIEDLERVSYQQAIRKSILFKKSYNFKGANDGV